VLTSALVRGEWSASRPCRFTPGGSAPGTHWIGGWVDLRASLDDVEKRKFLTSPGFELRPLGRLARSQSLYRLSYPGSRNSTYVLLNYGKIGDSAVTYIRFENLFNALLGESHYSERGMAEVLFMFVCASRNSQAGSTSPLRRPSSTMQNPTRQMINQTSAAIERIWILHAFS
jgi:hypothetical protein